MEDGGVRSLGGKREEEGGRRKEGGALTKSLASAQSRDLTFLSLTPKP